jgi:hypothetical protein
MSTENSNRADTTVFRTAVNCRAADETARLLAGLDFFVNAGDSDEEYRRLRIKIPTFWPLRLCEPDNPSELNKTLEWPTAGRLLFLAFRDYLRRLWRSDFTGDDGSMADGRYLQYVLGLETGYATEPPRGLIDSTMPNQAFHNGWIALWKDHPSVYCSGDASVVPSWKDSKFEYVGSNDFQKAAYQLFCQSWRARVCRKCSKYFIADKAAQMFCSIDCSNQNKLENDRRYWREKGTKLRGQRKVNKK